MKSLEDINILVVGDIMLDKYVLGEVERISPEAPVPIVHVYKEYCTLGGCGNVVRNIRELGPNVTCVSSIGFDENGRKISGMLSGLGVNGILPSKSKVTITKERIVASERQIQMIRIDREEIEEIKGKDLAKYIDNDKTDYDIIIVSDYAKGVISKDLMSYLSSRPERLVIDPKPQNKDKYDLSYLVTPNEKECKEMGGPTDLISRGSRYVLETKGRKGMELYDDSKNWNIAAHEVEVYNVSGAGDTVISVMATCLSMGWNVLDSAYIANQCAAYVVTKPGTSVVPKKKFLDILGNYIKGDY